MCQVIAFPIDRVKPAKRKRRKAKVESLHSKPDAKVLYHRASRLDESSDPKQVELAERLYREAVRVNPGYAMAYTNLGNILYRRGDKTEASALYRKALELDPEQPEANYNLGYWHQDVMDQPGTAICFYQEAIRLDPIFADAYYNLGCSYDRIGQRGLAKRAFSDYIRIEAQGDWAENARRYIERTS